MAVLKVGSQAQRFSFSFPLAEISVCGWMAATQVTLRNGMFSPKHFFPDNKVSAWKFFLRI